MATELGKTYENSCLCNQVLLIFLSQKANSSGHLNLDPDGHISQVFWYFNTLHLSLFCLVKFIFVSTWKKRRSRLIFDSWGGLGWYQFFYTFLPLSSRKYCSKKLKKQFNVILINGLLNPGKCSTFLLTQNIS